MYSGGFVFFDKNNVHVFKFKNMKFGENTLANHDFSVKYVIYYQEIIIAFLKNIKKYKIHNNT